MRAREGILVREIELMIKKSVNNGVFNAVALRVIKGFKNPVYLADLCYGCRDGETLFDLASITKPIVATFVYELARQRVISFDDPICLYLPRAEGLLEDITIGELVTHTSGLPPWYPFYINYLDRKNYHVESEEILSLFNYLFKDTSKVNKDFRYSDLNYILLGLVLDSIFSGKWQLFMKEMLKVDVYFSPLENLSNCAIPVLCGTRKEVLLAKKLGIDIKDLGSPDRGLPNDGNARFLGKVTAHAGAFASINLADWFHSMMARYSRLYLGIVFRRDNELVKAFGCLGKNTYGYPGFCGGIIWLDWDNELTVLLLAHKIDELSEIREFRKDVAWAIKKML